MNRAILVAAVATAVLTANAFAGPSAKFAATWGYGPLAGSVIDVSGSEDLSGLASNFGVRLATIKVPQDKELLIGLSAEIGITTDTSIKGRNGGAAKAIAGGGASVILVTFPVGDFIGEIAQPGPVVLSQRIQELDARLGGVIETCEDTTGGTDINGLNPGDDGYIDTPDGSIDVRTECVVTDEEIGLVLDTLASHHFNFVMPNMDAGEYDVVAFFITGASAEIDVDETNFYVDGNGAANVLASAYANVWIGKHMLTVQQVHAAKDGLSNVDIVD